MLNRVKALLTARASVLGLLLLLGAALSVAALVPQRTAEAPGGADSRGGLVEALGLANVFATRWFVALATVLVLALALSTYDQLRVAWARTFRRPGAGPGGVPSARPADEVGRDLRRQGYRRMRGGPEVARYLKFGVGHWGSFLLHLGMTVTALGAFVYVLTEHRLGVRAVTRARVEVDPKGWVGRRGLLAGTLPVPARVMLHRVEVGFRPDDQLADAVSSLLLLNAEDRAEELQVGLNDPQRYRGLLVYQLPKVGHAVVVDLRDAAGARQLFELDLPLAPRGGEPTYGSQPLAGSGLELKVKLQPGPERKRALADEPRVTLRLQEGDRVLGEATLAGGQVETLGPYQVRLAAVGAWTDILFEGSQGTPVIFGGFAVLMLGGLLIVFAVPREVVVRAVAGGCTIEWRAARFADFFHEERDRILAPGQGSLPT